MSVKITDIPEYVPEGFAKTIIQERYAFTEEEPWPETCDRVASQMAKAEDPDKVKPYKDKFYQVLVRNLFCPGGRIWYNSGRNNPQLLNCFVLSDKLDSKEGWGNLAREMIVTSMTGGGCVDKDTEFFTGKGWKKISDYKEGDLVGQYNDGKLEVVKPNTYVKVPCKTLNHIKKAGIDQVLCDDHTVVYKDMLDNLRTETVRNLRTRHEKTTRGLQIKFLTTFGVDRPGLPLTDDELRLQVAFIADGSFKNYTIGTACVRVKKERKKDRLVELLDRLGKPYEIRFEPHRPELYVIVFQAPMDTKTFDSRFYDCSAHQLKVITDEILYWDGHFSAGNRIGEYSTSKRHEADFIQYAFHACGLRTSIYKDQRQENTSFKLRPTTETMPHLQASTTARRVPFEPYETVDGFKYCFNVPSHMLVLRRNDKIFVTGNCGTEFSDVRPRGADITGQKGHAPGAVELMKLIDSCSKPVRAGGQRRVALMFSLDLEHPDTEEFLNAKLVKGELTHANVSVRCRKTREFIKNVREDGDWELNWKGKYKKKVKARKLWETIAKNAYDCAEPGFLNWELVLAESNIWYIEDLVTTNPCVSGDTEILTDCGPKRIDECVGQTTVIWNGWEYSNVVPAITGFNQEMVKVTFNTGDVLRCTKAHKFLIQIKGSVQRTRAKNLTVGMKIAPYVLPNMNGGWDLKEDVRVTAIEESGVEEKVYCFTEPKRHSGIFNGVMTGQCGEICLSPYDCCCLGHLVLPRFVVNGEFNWPLLAEVTKVGVRFLDNVLTVNSYPLPEMKEKSHNLRRIGLGTTGLADTLALLGLRYGSVEGNAFVDKLYRFISKVAYEGSVLLAVEKGQFPLCDREKHVQSGFIKRMTPKVKSLILEHGIRNRAILTQAPTGTTSILCGNISAAIDPIFAPAYERRWWDKDTRRTELVFHPLFDKFMKEGRDVSHFVGSRDLSVREHMEVQRIVQTHVDNAVSKTINIPADYPLEEVSELWLEYLPSLKGTTFYRENTRGYVDEKGVVHEPPLVALDLEEAVRRYSKEGKTEIVDMSCPKGVCDVPLDKPSS